MSWIKWRLKIRKLVRECYNMGGHHWIPTGMIDWECKFCPAMNDGPTPEKTTPFYAITRKHMALFRPDHPEWLL